MGILSEKEVETLEAIRSIASDFLVDRDGDIKGYTSNITAAVFAVAGSIGRLADAAERIANALERTPKK